MSEVRVERGLGGLWLVTFDCPKCDFVPMGYGSGEAEAMALGKAWREDHNEDDHKGVGND